MRIWGLSAITATLTVGAALSALAATTPPDASGPQMAYPTPSMSGDQAEPNFKTVVKPPKGIDPAIHAPAPEGGTMKVIRPPVTPNGKPQVSPP